MNTERMKIQNVGAFWRQLLECGASAPLWLERASDCPDPKRRRRFALPVYSKTLRSFWAAALLLALPVIASAQPFTLDWFSVDGGGGTSTGAVYSVSGTIGQPDTGTMSGTRFSLTGGFWGVVAAVQTPGAPLLAIERTATNTVLVAWPLPAEGFELEQTSTLNGIRPPWSLSNLPYVTNATRISVIAPVLPGQTFYRLNKPDQR